ncbi:MAG TPA: helical backbone metal receptor [Acidimicrobiia bacterium]|nr:helical backbone metal receptor [Acidimicrobiia bacterium]
MTARSRSPAPRVVSLVPSATETLLALGIEPVACTRFCEQPGIPTVGGTKTPDLAAIGTLAPDLVVMNDEENRREDFDALVAGGIAVHSISPRRVDEVAPAVERLARAVGVEARDVTRGWGERLDAIRAGAPQRRRAVTFVWRRPWMTLSASTYGSSLLGLVGFDNVFADAPDRYATVTLDEVASRRPDVALFPSEPYAFAERHRAELEAAVPGCGGRFVDGRDLFWWGIRTPDAAERLARALW